MEEKEEKPIFLKAVLIAVIVLVINLGLVVYISIESSQSEMTGLSISSTLNSLSRNYMEMPNLVKFFLIGQWVVIIIILFYSYSHDRKMTEIKNQESGIVVEKTQEIYKTDIDTLYNLLKTKKELRMSTIAKVFAIPKEIAFEWSKILESGELAYLDYSGFGEPRLMMNEKTALVPVNKPLSLVTTKKEEKTDAKPLDTVTTKTEIKTESKPLTIDTIKPGLKIEAKKDEIKIIKDQVQATNNKERTLNMEISNKINNP